MEAVKDGWQPLPETAGLEARTALQSMSWVGRQSAKRFIKSVAENLDLSFWCLVNTFCLCKRFGKAVLCALQDSYANKAAKFLCRQLMSDFNAVAGDSCEQKAEETPGQAAKPKAKTSEATRACSSQAGLLSCPESSESD